MKVIFIPYDRKGNNPYQKLLSNHLQYLGVNVEGGGIYRIFSLLRSSFSHWRPDILHLHWHHPFLLGSNMTKTIIKSVSFIAELLLLKLLGVKIVWTVHNITNYEEKFRSMELFFSKILSRLCNKIIVHSPAAKKKVIEVYGVNRYFSIVVIPHGNYINSYKNVVNKSEARNQLKMGVENLIYLYFGQIRPYKGIPKLVEAFKELNCPQAKLLIAGKPLNNKIAQDILKRCGENENIDTFFEFIPDDEIQTYMNAADVVVLPYRDFLTSGAVILAMSFGRPIIGPAIGSMLDVLDDKGSIIYNPLEKDGLLKAMKKALGADLKRMGNHNFELAKQFQWDDIAKRTYDLYRNCLNL
ncbi:MAG: glycosyltransferase [Candidatus Caldatribacteriota bacterium]